MKTIILAVAICLVVVLAQATAQETSTQQKQETPSEMKCPMHDAHSPMNQRGEKGMGFPQTVTTHHFFLTTPPIRAAVTAFAYT